MSRKNNFNVPVKELTHSYRTKFDMSHTVKGTFDHGKLVPFTCWECLPGDTFKIDMASIIRMSSPIAPLLDNIHMCAAVYFVPNRIMFDQWEQLMGVNKTGAWLTDPNTYVVPHYSMALDDIDPQHIGDYILGGSVGNSKFIGNMSCLPGRAYAMIWNEYYRSPVVSAPLPVDHSSAGKVLVSSATVLNETYGTDFYAYNCLPLAKYADYFTKCLPQPIKHDPIPFIADDIKVGYYATSTGTLSSTSVAGAISGLTIENGKFFQTTMPGMVNNPGLVGNVNATWNTIEALRTAFQLDKFYYKDSYARNYRDMLEAHFCVDNTDSVMQIPQKLGEARWRINIDQVLSTAGYSASSSTTVGAPGANSTTTNKSNLCTCSITEHGWLFIVGGARHDHTYAMGAHKSFTRLDRLDFYDPVFARIGDQPVMLDEIWPNDEDNGGNVAIDDTVFGYQEAWAEYRYKPDHVCGYLNPYAPSALDFWTLADEFSSAPVLNESFVYENRNSISRALVTGADGPDYIFDFYFKVTAVREMPLFSIPGLADHF